MRDRAIGLRLFTHSWIVYLLGCNANCDDTRWLNDRVHVANLSKHMRSDSTHTPINVQLMATVTWSTSMCTHFFNRQFSYFTVKGAPESRHDRGVSGVLRCQCTEVTRSTWWEEHREVHPADAHSHHKRCTVQWNTNIYSRCA